MPHRFFVEPKAINSPEVQIDGSSARQIRTVLRLQAGDTIVVLDNSGREWLVELTRLDRQTVLGRIIEERSAAGEPSLHLTLYQGTLKAAKFEWVLQKCTELGVSEFVPTICRRSVVREPNSLEKKRSRWESIIREAAEQSGRAKLPRLQPPLALADALNRAHLLNTVLMPWEMTGEPTLKQLLASVEAGRLALFIGPEGGFSPDEARLAQEGGARLLSLGPRILRAETAAIAAVAAIFHTLE